MMENPPKLAKGKDAAWLAMIQAAIYDECRNP